MKAVFEKVIPPKTGLAVEVKTGQIFRVTDLEGKQVGDMAVFNLANLREKLSTSYSHALRARARPAVYPTRQARGRRYVDVDDLPPDDEDSRGNAGDQGHARYAQPDVQPFPLRNLW